MPQPPSDSGFDHSLSLLREGYAFGLNRYRRLNTDIFQTRLLLQPTLCMRGEDAARLFYDNALFQRKAAMPHPIKKTLLGMGGVQGLDDEAHRHRKQMFMSLMTTERLQWLETLAREEWEQAVGRWSVASSIILLAEAEKLLCRVACRWCDVPLRDNEVDKRAADFGVMIDGAGSVGARHFRSRAARGRAERWIGTLIDDVREGRHAAPPGSALAAVATHEDTNGRLLETHTAAVELINLLRPIVAVGRYIVFAALALHTHPDWRQNVRDERSLQWFLQEVRRYFPFFPMVASRAREDFEWHGYLFPKGRRVLLDLYATNHSPAVWPEPEKFMPERFAQWDGSAFNFVPQGGGDHYQHHRCPGEDPTLLLMRVAVQMLTGLISYTVPPQDLHINLARMPAIPESRFVMHAVRTVN